MEKNGKTPQNSTEISRFSNRTFSSRCKLKNGCPSQQSSHADVFFAIKFRLYIAAHQQQSPPAAAAATAAATTAAASSRTAAAVRVNINKKTVGCHLHYAYKMVIIIIIMCVLISSERACVCLSVCMHAVCSRLRVCVLCVPV